MAAKAIWKGSIGFGMAHVPVKLMTAVREQEVKFKRWHGRTQSFPRQVQMVGDDEIVPLSEMTKRFDTETGFVEITEDDLFKIAPTSKRHMQINEFVPLGSIDPIYIEKSYFLAPDGAEFAYTLLKKALEERQRAAIARVMMRTKEHLVMIYVKNGTLRLSTMFYDTEIVADNGIYGDLEDVTSEALDTAYQLIDAYSEETYRAAKYKDIYTQRVFELIAHKEKGTTPESRDNLRPKPSADILKVLRDELKEMEVVAA